MRLLSPFPAEVAFVLLEQATHAFEALHAEEEALQREISSHTRRLEFQLGRNAVRQAMLQLGQPPKPLLKNPNRSPQWPQGICGSLSHSQEVAVAAVATSPPWISLGVDVESLQRKTHPRLAPRVLTSAEIHWLEQQPLSSRDQWLLIMFSIKEAVYKCGQPIYGKPLHFHDISLMIDDLNERFTWEWNLPGVEDSCRRAFHSGAWSRTDAWVVSGVWAR